MYIGCGDSGSGESSQAVMRSNPQRLDTMVGKILRIIPDLSEHTATSTISENGRYRIPSDNPFVARAGARKEIWAYGFRNPHRLSWAVDPDNPANNRLIATSIGLHTWETANIVRKGANYGYSEREGNERLTRENVTGALPEIDKLPVQIGSTVTDEVVVPTYPVLEYPHAPSGAMRLAAASSTTARRSLRCAENSSSPTFRRAMSGTRITRTCWPPTTATRRRWPRCTRSGSAGT
jgi:hypothetical protein